MRYPPSSSRNALSRGDHTVEACRFHKNGRAVTAQVVRAVPGAGAAVLQAIPARLSIYQDMGFRIVTEYRYWNFF
ncbi:hypothetical protein Aca07nite_51100 [Actinoplanes capillaceus]|uniref:Uncharacterized protein n=1 Tax=Actinoplanes campanulatus TaxID=113559 RepID=A0ABQ3WNS5_9ACTN|nr:hypothetical protein Aca07nite_51100 [Actinoplanes capillaceus]